MCITIGLSRGVGLSRGLMWAAARNAPCPCLAPSSAAPAPWVTFFDTRSDKRSPARFCRSSIPPSSLRCTSSLFNRIHCNLFLVNSRP
ncbi:hypothetical protein JI435_408130 [Parastagonospora nodorum SN15]|uniref:Uncharacterized protein n=1 Tax=Phaeosphaeria nodorum (strain SN15 / ATCC MYA-4574 / FGSC 10173) TaxID=321614 RepID=A0A7U2F1M8_PHANO|nr:hypothetical protein JI435_408130 [Parastagonospora nodorum SN15]